MTVVDIGSLAEEKASELMGRGTVDAWAACASIWARVYVLATPGWVSWPAVHATVNAALPLALGRCAGVDLPASAEQTIARLGTFDVEDDGSAEWQYTIDIVTMLLDVLHGDDVDNCVRTSIRTYLEGTFNILANEMAASDGRPISHADTTARMANDKTWWHTVEFVRSL